MNYEPFERVANLLTRSSTDEETSATREAIMQRDLERYYEILSFSLPKFSVGEADLLVDVFNGAYIDFTLCQCAWEEVEEGIELYGLDEKWEVNGEAFVAHIRSFSHAEWMAVLDATERYWRVPHEGRTHEDIMVEVGLVVGPPTNA